MGTGTHRPQAATNVAGLAAKASPAEIKEFIAKLHVIPDPARDFTSELTEATNILRIPLKVIDMLTGLGFPHRGHGADRKFDRCDLRSAMLHLGCGSMGMSMRRFWPTALNHRPKGNSSRYEITFLSDCTDPREADNCEVLFFLPGGYVRANERTPSRTASQRLTVDIPAEWPELGSRERDLIDSVAGGLEFMWLPEALRGDDEFMRRTGMGDCLGVAEILSATAADRGLAVRPSYGLIITPPFCATHYWADIMMDERWVPIDPLLIKAMINWGALRSPEWDIYRSPGPAVLRLGPAEWRPLAEHTCGSKDIRLRCGISKGS
jgi:hypothetical protein